MTNKVVSASITSFHFADDTVVNAEEEEEAGDLVDHLDTTTTRYKMEIGPDKTKVMTNKPKWLPKRDQDKRSEARSIAELQVHVQKCIWSSHL